MRFPVQELVVCGTKAELHKRRLVQAAQGTQNWVPWSERQNAAEAVTDTKALGAWVVVAEQTTARAGLSGDPSDGRGARWRLADVVEAADAAVVIPMLGMANSLNVATAAAILLYWLSVRLEPLAAV